MECEYIYENSLSAKSNLIEKGKCIEGVAESIFGLDEKNLIEKYKFYCKYLLSLNKDYVNNSVNRNYYEECEDYLKELERWLNKSNIDMRNMRLKNLI